METLSQVWCFLLSGARFLRLVLTLFRDDAGHPCSKPACRAEKIALRAQLATFLSRKQKPRRLAPEERLTLALLFRHLVPRDRFVILKPRTLLAWHRKAFRLLWKAKSRPLGRPPTPAALRALIREMNAENPTWGEERIAAELSVKLGLRISPRTVSRYLPKGPTGKGSRRGDQRWTTFVRNHAQAIVACDFFIEVTARFELLYVFVAMEVGSRRILHFNATANPTPAWTLQQFREALPVGHNYRFVLHDRDSIFSEDLDESLEAMGVKVVESPPRCPQANAYCERLIGTVRRECLDFMIPLSRGHLHRVLREWVEHYNRGRPHSSLGPGVPCPGGFPAPAEGPRHRLPAGYRVMKRPVLSGLHHEYWLEKIAA